jgi:hypothetical protein
LPVPLSPVMSTVTSEAPTRDNTAYAERIATLELVFLADVLCPKLDALCSNHPAGMCECVQERIHVMATVLCARNYESLLK